MIKKYYTIDLSPSREKLEEFEISDKNLVSVQILSPNGEVLKGEKYKVELTFSPDAMVGFGTHLIRKGLRAKQSSPSRFINEFEHIRPIDKYDIVTSMGIYLAPNSTELMITVDDLGDVENTIKELK